MNARARNRVGRYLRSLADEMGLRDWTFEIHAKPAEEDELAAISIPFGQRVGVIYLGDGWGGYKPEVQRSVLVHELMHCHLQGMWVATGKAIGALVEDQAARQALREVIRQDLERAVDDSSVAWAERLPLPN